MRLPIRKVKLTFSDGSILTVPIVRGDINKIVRRDPETNDLIVRVAKSYSRKTGKASDYTYIDVVTWEVVLS